jgi:hypothetical protein
MEIEKSKSESKTIDLINKIINLNDSIQIHHGDTVINRDGECYYIDFSKGTPQMKYVDEKGCERTYGEFCERHIGEYAKLDKPIKELEQDVFEIVMGNKKIEDFETDSADESIESNSQIIHLKSSDSLIKVKREMEIKRNYIKALHNRLEGMLNNKRRQLYAVIEKFNNKLQKIYKVLYTIELYLGVNEEVIQLTEGIKAPVDSPICLRQQILYMDEEIGIYEDGGMGFQDIPKFDSWISDHFKELLPEEKGVVVFRVRREKKDYGNVYSTAINKEEDMKTYFLIRNGNNLYRIFADIVVHPRLFPFRNEINKIYENIKSEKHFPEYRQKEVDNLILQYQRTALVLQGIIDRTDIFSPIPQDINIFNPDSYGNTLKLIYDEENILPDGRKSFNEWRKEINSHIERGSRIIYHYDWSEMREEYIRERYFEYRNYYPPAPKDCMFTVEDIVSDDGYRSKKEDVIKVLFFLRDWRLDERKRRTAFKLYFDDWFILNYDKISLEDLEFYIHSRVDRPNYLKMLPVLIEAKKTRLEELKWEKEFVRMTVEELFRENIIVNEEKVWEAVNWWKNKVIWKRPITKDDAKALRMIKSKLKNNKNI